MKHWFGIILGFGVIIAVILAKLGLWLLLLWGAGSLLTSTVKAIGDDCGKRYGIEAVTSGDWFCPTDAEKE